MVELDQVIETATIDALQRVAKVSGRVFHLLASDAVLDVIDYISLNARPSVAFLNSCQDFSNALMALISSCALYMISCW